MCMRQQVRKTAAVPCPVGTWVAGTTSRYNSTCVECAPNYFKADPGNAQCVLCPTGQYNDVYGSPKCDYCITDSVADATTNPSRGKFNLTNTCPYVIAQPNDAILLGPMWNTSSGESWTYDVISLPSNQTDGYLFDYEEGVPFVFDPLDSINHKLLSREYSVTTPFRFIKDEPGYPSYPPEDFTPGFYKDYPPQNIFGNPDQEFFRPYRYDGGEVSFIVDVSMPELNYTLNPPEDAAVLTTWYITDIWMFVQRDSANITGVDLYNYDDEQWYPVFRGSLGPMKGSFIDDTTYYTVVNFCRRDIKTNRLRLTFDTKSQTKESMGVSIDSFTAACYLEQRKKRYWTLTDPGARAWFVPLGNYSQQLFSKALQLAKYSCDGDGPWNESIQLQVNSVVLNEEGSISTPILATMIALVVACEVVLVLTFCGVMYYRHEHARLKKASPVFMMLMLVGGIISLPVPLIYLATEGSWGCYTGMCLWNCGFVITFGALFIKTYRIRMIFGSDIAKLKNSGASLGDNQLLQHLGGMFVVCSVGLSIYLALYPISRDSQILAGIEWQVCEVGPLQAILVGIQLAIMVLGAMLAYQVRSAPSDFSESKMIGLSIYNWVFITIVAIVTILATDSGVNVQLIIMTMYMVLVYMVVNCLMVVFKLWKVFRSEVQRLSNHNTSAAKDDSYNTRNHEASDRSGGDSIAQPSQRQLLPMSGPSGQGDRGSAGILHVKGVSEPINTDKQSSSGNFNSVMFTSSGGGLLSYPTAASSSSNGSLQRSNSNNATPNNTTGNTNSAATRKREYKRAAGVIKGPGSASINTAACVDDRCIVEADDVAEGASSDLTEV
ncbi:hypothetical protein SARC_00957 [Sphaeroforma arctica JP610]|uniref:G-protein coupled receptors family 3 profile domain-containing protein n=1 Tax=Sphaeroforma arctica JP610 TaxID=667725 RepID=A0A0L0GD17_9EUKA|nr:hypothetical protein SARC_00957 [Sphaeroforma arctica JP610]KNC86912.1 hypothetical protein SARC_00957 [Sphaeroforma arctica JP610]|eukprot:XP_014160814.1 hypothetical protein SARC_00957 [Sphaeroforma arctica JP610]